jgi:hypothetical protein
MVPPYFITLSARINTFGGIAYDFGFSMVQSSDYFVGSS